MNPLEAVGIAGGINQTIRKMDKRETRAELEKKKTTWVRIQKGDETMTRAWDNEPINTFASQSRNHGGGKANARRSMQQLRGRMQKTWIGMKRGI